MKVLFIASFAPIVPVPSESQAFYRQGIGVPFDQSQGDYVFTEKFEGAKHFGLWPLKEAARACFGTDEWPSHVKVPQASLEFEVEDVAAAAEELAAKKHTLLHGARTEPWGQQIARLLSPEGLLVGVCYTPWMRESKS